MNGFIKTYRSLLDWEWYGHPDMVALWLHLLLTAAYKDCCIRCGYQYVDVKRGQVVTNRRKLARETGLSERQIRTCLDRLKTSQEVAIKATHKFSLITICKFDSYQSKFYQSDPQSDPKKDPQSDPHNKEYKEDNNITPSPRARLESETILNSGWLDHMSMSLHSPDVMQIATNIMNEWELQGVPADQWNREKLFRYVRNEINYRKRQGKQTRQEAKEERRADLKMKALNELNAIANGNYQQPTDRNGYSRQQ